METKWSKKGAHFAPKQGFDFVHRRIIHAEFGGSMHTRSNREMAEILRFLKENAGAGTNKKKPAGAAGVKKVKVSTGEPAEKSTSKSLGGSVKAAQPFNPVDDCERLYECMVGSGTKEAVITDVLSKRSNSQRQEIKAKFKDKYGKNLQEELESELSGDYEEIVLALMMKPTEYDAHCLHDAVSGLGTRETPLTSILCTRSPQDIAAIRESYKTVYGKDLDEDIASDVSGGLETVLRNLLKGHRDQSEGVNIGQAREDARKLHKCLSVDDDGSFSLLVEKNKAQAKATLNEYNKLTGYDIYKGIEQFLDGDSEKAYRLLVQAVEDPIQFYADRLYDSFDGAGVHDKQLIRLLVSRSEIDLEDIKQRFRTTYRRSLSQMIQEICTWDYKKMLLTIVGRDK